MMTENTATNNPTLFGLRLQSARETLGLETKDAAAQLRLNEKVILMLETDCYSSDLPPTFLRGYIRAYGKLLQIPEQEIQQAIEPIQPKKEQPSIASIQEAPSVTSSNHFVQIFTYLILFTLLGLVGAWWYSHSAASSPTLAEKQINLPLEASKSGLTIPEAVKTDVTTASVNLGAKLGDHAQPPAASSLANATSNDEDQGANDAETDDNDNTE